MTPVLIAGAGPVGMIAALLLARFDVPTLVLEAKPERDAIGSKAICFQRDVLDILDRVGVAQRAVEEGVTWSVGRTYYREHELFHVVLPDSGSGALPPFINLSQSALENYLFERVEAEPLVEVRFGCRVDAVDLADDARVHVATASGTFEGEWLLACDGFRSGVRQALGIAFEGHSFDEQFLIADIVAQLPFPAERRFFFDPEWNPGRQVLVHPQPHSVWRIDWQVPADFDLEKERASGALDQRIRRITGDAPYEIDWMSVYRFHQRLAGTFRRGRVLLCGDAAHLMAPFGARGLNSGAQDAENAAWKLAFVLKGWADPSLLDSYEIERRAAAEENLRVTAETMRFLVPHGEAERRHRLETLARAVTDPSARASVNSGKLAEPYWYLDSPLTTPAGDVSDFPRQPGVPRPVVPGVLCPDGPVHLPGRPEVTRLRQLLGRSVVLLSRGVSVDAADGPVEALDLDGIDVDGRSADHLGLSPGECLVVRPDGHVAARLPASAAAGIAAAVTRCLGG